MSNLLYPMCVQTDREAVAWCGEIWVKVVKEGIKAMQKRKKCRRERQSDRQTN